jgi:putative membrane protein
MEPTSPTSAADGRGDAAGPPPEVDRARVERPSDAELVARPFGPATIATTFASGLLMGSADLVPGVSGGTIALVLGIYERLVANIRQGSRAASLLVRGDVGNTVRALRFVEWSFLVPLLAGVLTAVAVLATWLEHLLETQPVMLSATFAGLIVGSVLVSVSELHERSPRIWAVVAASTVATFLLLGLRSGRFEDPTLLIVLGGGALAICAMILPGISGSFILLMIGLYEYVLGAVSDRDVAVIAVFGVGAVVGLGAFSTFLNWLLREFREVVLAVLIGLMAGSLRVLWPWPAGEEGVGTTSLESPVAGEVLPALGLALAGALAVVVVAGIARRLSEAGD